MIVTEFLETRKGDNVKLYITYSDLNFKIKKVNTGELYSSAVDTEFAICEYIETDIPIKEEEV